MHWYHWARGNVWHPSMRNLWVLSAFITAIASRQNKGNSTVLALCSSCGSPESSMAHSGQPAHTNTHTYTQSHQWIGFAVQCSYVLQGSGWAVTSLHYREASIIQYTISLFCMIYVGPRKMKKSLENQRSEWTLFLKRSQIVRVLDELGMRNIP